MSEFNGLNGDILLNTAEDTGVLLGRVPGEPYGYDGRLRLSVNIRVEELLRREVYETTEHDMVERPLSFAMSAQVWRPDLGDIVCSAPGGSLLMESLYDGDWLVPTEQVLTLASLGERWHLNDMPILWKKHPRYSYSQLNLEGPRCPITDYKLGSAWLIEELPPHFMDRLNLALKGLDQTKIYRKNN